MATDVNQIEGEISLWKRRFVDASHKVATLRTSIAGNGSEAIDTITAMPRISEFYGIVIEMYFDDHPPPHFHARHGGDQAVISFEGELLAGSLPSRSLTLVRRWSELHREELHSNWRRLERDESPRRIEPLP